MINAEILLKTIFEGGEAKRYLDAVVAFRWDPLKHLFVVCAREKRVEGGWRGRTGE